jgi:acetone carboxylase, alpha subunit
MSNGTVATTDKPKLLGAIGLKRRLEEMEQTLADTGHYDGIEELALRAEDPLKYERTHTRLSSAVIAARETSKLISASPGVREVGESVVGLFTPEGDSVVFSAGIMVHVHSMSRFIKWMIRNDYENDPGIEPGDIFANNDAFIGCVQLPDVMDVIPIFRDGELVAWAGSVCHELEVGGIVAGGDINIAIERFGEGMPVCAEKVGTNDEIRRDYLVRAERSLRTPIYWILDEKAKVSACLEVRDKVNELIDDLGTEYFKQAIHEYIEEGRRTHLERMKVQSVPGRYRGVTFYGNLFKDKPGVLPVAAKNELIPIPVEVEIDRGGFMSVDFEGAGPWGWHPNNCSPAAMEGGFFVNLTQFMDYDGMVNDGAALATELKLPEGTWTNPDSEQVATACGWALMNPAYGTFVRLMARAHLARGFKEEIFVGGINCPFFEAGGISQYGTRFGASNFELSAAGSGARGIMDGIDTGYAIFNPESDMGNAEVWETALPVLYLGRRIWADSGGAGKFRGGVGFTSLYKAHRTPLLSVTTAVHSGKVFDNAGICGGYPSPSALYHYAIRDNDLAERIENRDPLPVGVGDADAPDMLELISGDVEYTEGVYVGKPLKDGDLFQHSYIGGGGYGDPIERSPDLVRRDLDVGKVSERLARNLYRVAFELEDGEYKVDAEATAAAREAERERRLSGSVPAAEWFEAQRKRVVDNGFCEEVSAMYHDAMELSERWRGEYAEFWKIDGPLAWEESK